jgi:hypothetical protein
LVFDERLPCVEESSFLQVNWGGFHGTEKEEMPPKMPTARGNSVRISCFVDANHAGNIVTRRQEVAHRCVGVCEQRAHFMVLEAPEHGGTFHVWE